MNEPQTPLSASRMKTAQSCSWLYNCKYKLCLPDKGNDGSSRGSVCHLVFEMLGRKDRRKRFKKILKSKNVFSDKAIKRLIIKNATRLGVNDEENMNLIKEMILNGLEYDFYGEKFVKPIESLSEKDFEIVVSNDDVKYKIKGFIDKLFLYKDSKAALIRDFKTSKQKFKGKEITDNLQDYMYSLAVRHLYPEYKNRISEFLFLKFDLNDDLLDQCDGSIKMDPISDDDLDGFE